MDHVKAVLSAAEQGNQQAMCSFLEKGTADVCDEEGSTPLMYAAANGREAIIRLLLQNHVNPNAQNAYKWTAMMQAACYGHLGSVLLLLQAGAEVNAKNCWETTALVGAAQGGFSTIVQYLLKHGAVVNPTGGNSYTLTPLMAAAQCGHMLILSELLKHSAEVNARFLPIGWTALMLAVLNNQLEAVKLLLQHGADPKLKDVNGKDAAQLAKSLGYNQVASLLSDCTEVEFFELVKQGLVDRVKNILSYKQEWASIRDKDGATPLMYAANKGFTELCEALVAAGADLDVRDSVHGWTALMQATHQRRHSIVELMLKSGADVAIKGKNGTTAMDIADKIGDAQITQLIGNVSRERDQRDKPGPDKRKMQLDLKGLRGPSEGVPGAPTLGSPRVSVGDRPKISSPDAVRTPTAGTPLTTSSTPQTPLAGAVRTPTAGTPLSLLPSTPQVPLAGAVQTPQIGTPLTPLASSPRAQFVGALRTPLAGVPATPGSGKPPALVIDAAHAAGFSVPEAQGNVTTSDAVDPNVLIAHLQNAFKMPDTSLFPDLSPPPSPQMDSLQPKFPLSRPYSAPTSLSSSLEEQQLNTSTPLVKGTSKGPASALRVTPPRVQGGGALGKLLAGGALVPGPKSNITGKGGSRIGQGLSRVGGFAAKQELPSPQKFQLRSPLPPHAQLPRQQLPSKAFAVPSKATGALSKPTTAHHSVPVFGRGQVGVSEPNPDLGAILTKHSLEHHSKLFSEQEVDYHSFLSLSVGDLKELGVSNEEEQLKLLELIERLNAEQDEVVIPTNTDAPSFVFQ